MTFSCSVSQQILTCLLFVCLAVTMATTAVAQFPTRNTSQPTLSGHWRVTNLDGAQIELQFGSNSRFQMAVSGTVTQGNWTCEGDSVTLDFNDGTQQQFEMLQRSNASLVFATTDGSQRFEMEPVRGPALIVTARKPAPRQPVGQDIGGVWFAKIVAGDLTTKIKMDFKSDGTYQNAMLTSFMGQQDKQSDGGRWSVQGTSLLTQSSGDPEPEAVPFRFEGENLILDLTSEMGVELVLSRNTNNVKPTRADLQTLIDLAQKQEEMQESFSGSDNRFDQ